MDSQKNLEPTQPNKARKLSVQLPEELLSSLRTTCAQKANLTLIGRIQGKHPGHKALTAWARDTLHSSFECLSVKTNNLFEVTFSTPEGRIHAFTQSELICASAYITFSSWRPHLDTRARQTQDFPIWLQIVDLCQILRDETFLRTIGGYIGQVIAIDNSEAYRTKLYGPRVRLLVRDLESLPQTLEIPRLDEEGVVEYKLEYSGLPNQCGRSTEHQVRNCPKKETRPNRRAYKPKTLTEKASPALQVPPSTPAELHHSLAAARDTTPTSHHFSTPAQAITPDKTHTPTPTAEPTPIGVPGEVTRTGSQLLATQEDMPMENTPYETTHSRAEEDKISTASEAVNNIPSPIPAQETTPDALPELQPNEVNFPHLNSPGPKQQVSAAQSPTAQPPGTPHTFVWRMKPLSEPRTTDKGKEKTSSDSAPITRQGYRSGRLAEDFWDVLEILDTPKTPRKKLRVFPLITKNQTQQEYLVDTSKQLHKPITTVYIAEVLAGIPWSKPRAKQHVVNEVTQSLHKIMIFNNQHTTPFQKWSQGRWHSHWTTSEEGEHMCTLYVVIPTPESKVKIRKGKTIEWTPLPGGIKEILTQISQGEEVSAVGEAAPLWQELTGSPLTTNLSRYQPQLPRTRSRRCLQRRRAPPTPTPS
jgi:hypothetical protein